jgi:hypothetical protein
MPCTAPAQPARPRLLVRLEQCVHSSERLERPLFELARKWHAVLLSICKNQ